MSIRRVCRSSFEYGVEMNASIIAMASSVVCMRAPTETTFALLCSRDKTAKFGFQARAARIPKTLFAAICSPFPEPPRTIPRDPESVATASAVRRQNGG